MNRFNIPVINGNNYHNHINFIIHDNFPWMIYYQRYIFNTDYKKFGFDLIKYAKKQV